MLRRGVTATSSSTEYPNREYRTVYTVTLQRGSIELVLMWCVQVYVDTEPVNICCQKSELSKERIKLDACITQTEDFALVCLHKTVLETALGRWHHEHDERMDFNNRNYRFIAYRQYIGWIYGRLGRGERRAIPSCILYII